MKSYKIACVPGDGIGNEVVPESLKVLDTVAVQCGFKRISRCLANTFSCSIQHEQAA